MALREGRYVVVQAVVGVFIIFCCPLVDKVGCNMKMASRAAFSSVGH